MDDKIVEIIRNTLLANHEKLSSILHYLIVEKANISQDDYYIIGSYSLRNYREINDLDVVINNLEFDKLKLLNIGLFTNKFDEPYWLLDMTKLYNDIFNENISDFSIEIFSKSKNKGIPTDNFSLQSLNIKNGLEKDENKHSYFSLLTLLDWKLTMNRGKDQKDIEIIKNILE